MVSPGGSSRASSITTQFMWLIKNYEAEGKEFSAATESDAALKQQTLLDSEKVIILYCQQNVPLS